MSRLDSFIRRMKAQRDLIEFACGLLEEVPGPIVDLGLGAGRTFDHLRRRFPEREVFAFDRHLEAALEVLPDPHHMVLGDIRETLGVALPRLGGRAALVHNDLGSGDEVFNRATAAWLTPLVEGIVAPGAIVVTSFPMPFAGAVRLAPPPSVPPGRYHVYKVARLDDHGAATSGPHRAPSGGPDVSTPEPARADLHPGAGRGAHGVS